MTDLNLTGAAQRPVPHVLPLAFFAFVVYGLPASALGVAWLRMADEFGRTLESLGLLLAVLMLGNLPTSANSGRLIARFTLGPTLLGGSLLMLAGLVGYAVAPSWGALLAATLLLGLGMGALNSSVNTFVAHHYRAGRMNWLHACYGLGSTLGPLLVTLLVLRADGPWRLAFALIAFAQGAVSALLALTLKNWQLDVDTALESSDRAAARPGATDSLRLLVVWLGVALYFVHNGLALSAGQFASTLFVDGRGVSAEVAGAWVSVYFSGMLVGRVLLGLAGDRLEPGALLRVGTGGAVLGAALLWWAPLPLVGFVGLALMGLALSPVYPTGMALTPRRVGRRHSANAIGFQIAGGSVGSALVPYLLGLLTHPFGLGVIAAALFALAVLQFFVHERLLRQDRPGLRPAAEP